MRAIVVKSHHHSTVMDVLALGRRPERAAQRVFGGIALNAAVGGINPHAVDLALKMGGRIVWFPTIASEKHIRHHPSTRTSSSPSSRSTSSPRSRSRCSGPMGAAARGLRDPRVHQGPRRDPGQRPHGPHQITAVFEAAREIGIERMLVNHPNFVIEASFEDARRWVELGAYIEHSLCMYDEESSFHNWDLDTLVGGSRPSARSARRWAPTSGR